MGVGGGGKRHGGHKTWGAKDLGGKRHGGGGDWGAKDRGAKDQGAKDRGAKDQGAKVLEPHNTQPPFYDSVTPYPNSSQVLFPGHLVPFAHYIRDLTPLVSIYKLQSLYLTLGLQPTLSSVPTHTLTVTCLD